MTELNSVASFRRVTPGIVASARLAMANDVPDVSKGEIALLLKKAAPILGIDGTTYHVMDILLGLSRADDWRGASRPIVAISNAKLAEYTMRSQRTVIRCVRRLVEVGIAAYRDSSTGRRFIYRDDAGAINAGYGIDFTPARVRVAELKAAVEEYQRKLGAELAAKRDIARLARAIEDICRAFPDRATELRQQSAALVEAAISLELRAEGFRELHAQAVDVAPEHQSLHDMSREGDIHVTPNIYTNPESSSESRQKRTRSNEREQNYISVSKADENAFEKKHGAEAKATQEHAVGKTRVNDVVQAEVLGSVSIGLLRAACPQAQSMIGAVFDSWSALGRSGEMLRRMVGLSESGWNEGKARAGILAATAILATVVEKSIRDPEQISKPGGYFRAMIDRAVEGKLNLERSLFGLADVAYGNVAG
ncbi:replication protein C [Rhizobium sp. CF080]|uniref:plasmid replication protein RepC n=1 Tax=Rhizobium sp. (strain CF080) TaxID=1144310 RepID=UPI0002715738|nr:plasmid replication protein RepC [Rhizobium sp. CF080]EUB98269.1 replication protein C [Rhizobium sp. CF080]